MHSSLIAKTTGLVYINPAKVQEYVNEYIEEFVPDFKGCYVNVRVQRGYNAPQYIEDYIEKTRQIELE